jgi:AcrR family transcriptional regulator
MCPESSDSDVRKPGRPRSSDADRAIIEATLELLVESGVAATAIEHVAARAGVSKATIYRRWPNKDALIIDAIATVEEPDPELPGTSLRDDLVAISTNVIGRKLSEQSNKLYAWMAAEADRVPEIRRQYKNLVVERRRAFVRRVLCDWQAQGELRADVDIEVALLLVVGPVLAYRMHWFEKESAPDAVLEKLIDAALQGIQAHS